MIEPERAESSPELDFAVLDSSALEFAGVPTLRFRLRITSGPAAVRALALNVQLRIAAARRSYSQREQARLAELFGEPSTWARSARSLFWTQVTLQVPAFSGETVVELPVPCTYDFEVAVAKYFHGLEQGEIPLEFLFSGSLFYVGEAGLLRVSRIAWDREAQHRLPLRIWKEMMDHFFPNSAWLRLHRDVFDRLYAFKSSRTLPTWEDAVEALLARTPQPLPPRGKADEQSSGGTAELEAGARQ